MCAGALTRRSLLVLVLMLGHLISTQTPLAADAPSTIEGKIAFAGKAADKTILELTAGGSRIIAELPAQTPIPSLLNHHVRLTGNLLPANSVDGYPSAGRLILRDTNSIKI